MLRQFLTVLALISGFAALAEPAQAARIAASVESASVAEQGAACAVTHSGLVAERFGSGMQRVDMAVVGPRELAQFLAPTVQLQADRARE